jgi:hypothetical protein
MPTPRPSGAGNETMIPGVFDFQSATTIGEPTQAVQNILPDLSRINTVGAAPCGVDNVSFIEGSV